MQLIREQDLEYYQSLLQDQLKELQLKRNEQRNLINQLLVTKIPTPLEKMLNPTQEKLLRVYKLRPSALSEKERHWAESTLDQLQRWRSGGCFNLSATQEQLFREQNRIFSFSIPGTPINFCLDILSPLEHGTTNFLLNLVDVFIEVGPGERYRYPLNEEDAGRYFQQVQSLGIDVSGAPQMDFPEIISTYRQIQERV